MVKHTFATFNIVTETESINGLRACGTNCQHIEASGNRAKCHLFNVKLECIDKSVLYKRFKRNYNCMSGELRYSEDFIKELLNK